MPDRPWYSGCTHEEGTVVVDAPDMESAIAAAKEEIWGDDDVWAAPVTAADVEALRDRIANLTDALRDVLTLHGCDGWHGGALREGRETQEKVLNEIHDLINGIPNASP